MNPEEGDLRPQLLDRFGFSVEIYGETNPADRVEVIKRRLAYEQDHENFLQCYVQEQRILANRIMTAKKDLHSITISDEMLHLIANISIEYDVEGHRTDLTMMKAAITLAAFEGQSEVQWSHIEQIASLVLLHRIKRRPFDNLLTASGLKQQIREKLKETVQ